MEATINAVAQMSWKEKRDVIRRADRAIDAADQAITDALQKLHGDLGADQLERELSAEPALGIGRSPASADDV